MFLEMHSVQLIKGDVLIKVDVWGHRKDINEDYTIPFLSN
jgi:hypothetical protein